MASGKLSEFDVVNGNWSTYCDRVEMYFLVNKVTEELKVPTIISIIGDTSYELIVNLCSPKKPSELEYAELKKLMQSHLEPKPSVLAERYRFRQYRQREGQTIAEFVSEIKKMARYCDFGANLNENMRDQFVCGLLKEGMRHRLFLEDEKIDFEKAVSLAKAFEGAERNALYTDMSGAGGGAGNGDRAPRDSITRRFSNNRSSLDGVNFMEESMHRLHAGVSCSACGDHRHRWSECRFRDYVCDYCAKRGHLKRVCSGLGRGPMRREKGGEGDYSRTASSGPSGWRSKEPPRQIRGGGGGGGARDWGGARRPQRGALRSVTRAHYVRDDQEHFTERSEEEEVPCDEEPIMQLSLKEYKPVSLILLVEESNVCMEIDTGSALSCISSQLYRDKFHHKPLLSIFNPGAAIPSMTASRLQRWALTLSGYSFSIEYVSTDSNTADALSRMIAAYKEERVENHNDCPEQTYLHFASEALLLDHNVLKKETSRDPILSRVLGYIRDGWPNEVEIREIKPYFNRRSELYIELGCIMWGHRVVVPYSCREKVLNELHDSHMGIIKTKCLARSYVWFPGIDESVDRQCASCEVCAQTAAAPPAHAPRVWHWPDRPWSRLHLDFLGPIAGATYLVVVDACSKWIEIARMSSTSAANVISKLREICSRFGLPKQVVSDNGPPFSSEEFAQFLNKNGIEHCFSAPYHPASNGAAESAVKICKQIIKKAIIEKNDVDTALWRSLLVYRNTEHSTTGESPAQLLQGRALRTRLDCVKPDRAATVRSAQRRQEAAAGGVRRSLPEGEYVWYRTYRPGHKWAKGRILQVLGSTDYQLESYDGTVIHRHVDQIRRRVQSNLNDSPISWYDNPSNGIHDHGPGGDAVGAQAGVGVSSAPTTSGSPRGGGGGAAATSTAQGPASLTPTDEQSTRPGQSAPGRRYPLRERRPVVRYGLEID